MSGRCQPPTPSMWTKAAAASPPPHLLSGLSTCQPGQRLPQRAGITDMSKVMHWACMESPSCRIWHMQGRGPSVHCYNWRQVALPVAGRLPPDYLHVKHEAVAAPCPLSAPLVHTGIWCCMDVVHSVVPILGLCRHGRHAHPRAQPGSRLGLGKSGAGGSGVACSAGLGF